MDRSDAVAVIGTGPHGLSALKALLQLGIPAHAYERASDLGGNWNFGAPTSRVYESTHLISSKPFTQFPDFPMPDDYPDYPSHRQVKAYFDRYAAHFGLRDHITFDATVTRVEAVGDQWDVTINESQTIRYGAVVVANGHNWHAKIPDYPGDFGGEVIHSADYKSAAQLRGKRVLVVGAGNTGCDIAVEAAQNATQTFHSTRRGYYYNPKFVFGKPSDQIADQLLAMRVPLPMRRAAFGLTLRTVMGKFEKFGLQKPDHAFFETHPIVNQQLVYYVGHGDITPKPDIDHFDTEGAVFTDGTRADVDVVVFATGYLAVFPFLADPDDLDAAAGRPRLGLQMASPKHPTLWLSGLIQPDSGQWTIAHWQGMAIAEFLRLYRRDPVRAKHVHAELNAHRDQRFAGGAHYKESTRHYYEIAHQDYLAALQQFLRSMGVRRRVLRRAEWAWPTKPVHLEILSVPGSSDLPPLLFVHGLGHGAWCFEQWLDLAAQRGFEAHALSLRGHGGSGGQQQLGRTTLRDYEHDVLQAITRLSRPPVLVGHSLGALVVQRVLQRYPAYAGVLLTPIPAVGAPGTVGQLARRKPMTLARATAGGSIRLTADDLFAGLPDQQARDYATRVGRESRWAQYAMLRPERVGEIDAPLLVVGAEGDALVAAGDVRRCAAALSADLRWVPGGHDVMLDAWRGEALDGMLEWIRLTQPLQTG